MDDMRIYQELPKPHLAYAGIVKSLLPKHNAIQSAINMRTYGINDLQIDAKELKAYRRVCGFFDDGRVPITYFAVLSQQLQLAMMTQEPFGFAILGLVHIKNCVCQYRHIGQGERFDMRVRFDNLVAHDLGQAFDFVTEVYVKGVLVWQGSSTYLARQKTGKKLPKSASAPIDFGKKIADISAPEGIGRRYAMVSHDYNPIHLHALSARAFGFMGAIAHGMWTKAKCLSKLDLPAAVAVQVQFRAPVFLPSKCAVYVNDDVPAFYLVGKGERVHLIGTIQAVDGATNATQDTTQNHTVAL